MLKIYVTDFGMFINNSEEIKWFSNNDLNSVSDYTKSQAHQNKQIKIL